MKKHMLPVEIAIRYGMDEAVLLQGLADLMATLRPGEDCVLREGRLWIIISTRQLQAEFPYMSTYLIKKTLDSLIFARLLDQDSLQDGQLRRRRVGSYALTSKAYELLENYKEPNFIANNEEGVT